MATTIFVGELMTQKLETIGTLSSAQEASKKMRDNNVSSLVVIDDSNNKPIGIVTERDLVRKVCVNDTSSNSSSSSSKMLIKNIMSSPLVTIDATLSVEAAADAMIQNKVRHLLVIENNDINRPLGIVTPTDFVAYLKENLNVNEANARILESLKGQQEEENVVEELEQEGKLKKNSQKGGQEYEDEEPRQG
jgi:CBS domain-containing protein